MSNRTINVKSLLRAFSGKCKQTHVVYCDLHAGGDPVGCSHPLLCLPGIVTARADNITLLTDIFLRLIKMVIAPLVFSTLTVGIMRTGETSTIGRVGGKAMIWFISSSILSILVGLFVVSLEQPGSGLNLAIPLEATDTGGCGRYEPERFSDSHHPHQHRRGDGK